MGRACLRGHRHRRLAGGAGRIVSRRQQPINHSNEPDVAATDAHPELPASSLHPVRVGDRERQRDAYTNAEALGIRICQSIGNCGNERVADTVPITESNRVSLGERQTKTIRIAVA
jgi:hypothetical protein